MGINIDPENIKSLAEDVDIKIASMLKKIKELEERIKVLENK